MGARELVRHINAVQRSAPARAMFLLIGFAVVFGGPALLVVVPSSSAVAPPESGPTGDASDMPPPGVGEQAGRVMAASSLTGNHGFAYLELQDTGGPVTYDPCRPIHFVVNTHDAPVNVADMVQQAVKEVQAASGLKFVDDGATDEKVTALRESYQPTTYGEQWAPILIDWSAARQFEEQVDSELGEVPDEVDGYGRSEYWSDSGGHRTYVTGVVLLNSPLVADEVAEDGFNSAKAVVIHELGHVLGLAHVSDPRQLMYFQGMGEESMGEGDLRGFAAVGKGTCEPDL